MPPQSYVTRRIKELESARFSDQACAIGTVPIRRTTKEELAMAGALNHKAISASDANSPHVTMIYVYMQKLEQRRYHGASAVISVHSLNITDRHQYSTASVWIENGPYDALNMISVGWMVKSDSVPRLYLYWTADGGHKTGCYNLFCQGFVQVDPKISLGQILEPVSSYGGPIYDVKIKVFQDRETKTGFSIIQKKIS
ncbi:uncharacterized protein LOC116106695 [Pistacia vera]|uniref:uncharacterized protein LOC116106695 n=1 Tax=Pistacia vera TaxID=55513 RepID=UPI001263A3C2|nr:uncharacterized protein LOC116106695 [Pistacia vera]